MQVTGNKISNNSKIIRGSFSDQLSGIYDLFIYQNETELSCTVADTRNTDFIAFENWQSLENLSALEFLQSVLQESDLLKNNIYRRVIYCSGFRNGTFIPNALYSAETSKDQLLLSSEINANDEFLIDEVPSLQAKIVYSMPIEVVNLITSQFRNVELHHTANSVASYLLTNRKNANEALVHINILNNYFEVYVTRGNQLFLYNTYNSHSAEEMLYYILFVCEQLHLNPETVDVVVSGKINNEHPFYQLAGTYFKHFGFAERPANFSYTFSKQEIPAHVHFNLFSQLICVL
jgi:hypothetical protein